jgi:hypothetical protein
MVPLADMLTNTVGIMVFILIFTVLAASGAILKKRFPLEHKTEATPVYVLCRKGRLLPLDNHALIERFFKPLNLKNTQFHSIAEMSRWCDRFNAQTVSDEFFRAEGRGSTETRDMGLRTVTRLDLSILFHAQEGKGYTLAELQRAGSFQRILNRYTPKERFIYFKVCEDSLALFVAARDMARNQKFSTGWSPAKVDKPIGFALTGGGRSADPTDP